MKFFDQYPDFKKGIEAWEDKSKKLKKSHPLKVLKNLPQMPGITPETKKGLRWKSLKYLISEDEKKLFRRFFFRRPIKYGAKLLISYLKKAPYKRTGDFFFYGINNQEEFQKKLQNKNSKLVVGFSYCHKPFECPSGRFTDQCVHDLTNPTCGQCFIGKCAHALPESSAELVFIPTIHYIGEKMFEMVEKHPQEKVLFLITACEMTLEMFADWGNMIDAQGIGVRLDGRICNTMKAFELSEKGIKPGLTVVLDQTQQELLELLRLRRETFSS